MQALALQRIGETKDFKEFDHVVCNQFIYRFGQVHNSIAARFNLDRKINVMGTWEVLQPFERPPFILASKGGKIYINDKNGNGIIKTLQYDELRQCNVYDVQDNNASIIIVDRKNENYFFSKQKRVFLKSNYTTREITAPANCNLLDCLAYNGTLYWFTVDPQDKKLFAHSLTDAGKERKQDTGMICLPSFNTGAMARTMVPLQNRLYALNNSHILVIHCESLSCNKVYLEEPCSRLVGASPSGGLIAIARRKQTNYLILLDLNPLSSQAPEVMGAPTRMKYASSADDLSKGIQGMGLSPRPQHYRHALFTPPEVKAKLYEASQVDAISENNRLKKENAELKEQMLVKTAQLQSIQKLVRMVAKYLRTNEMQVLELQAI